MTYTKNDWLKCYYDSDKKLCVDFKCEDVKSFSFKEALIYNAEETLKEYPNDTFDLMFSGGVDSELVLRTYIELGSSFRVNIFRYENNYNEYDVSFAQKICNDLGVRYSIIDFNLENFYKKEALDIYNIVRCSHARALPYCSFIRYVDGIPVYGEGDMIWSRPDKDYSKRTEWKLYLGEYELAWDRYAEFNGKKSIGQWFRFTPEVMLAYMHTEWFKNLVFDKYIGKLGVSSTKYIGYREAYPDLIERIKKSGFENVDDLILPFQEKLKDENGNLKYSQFTSVGLNKFYRYLTGSDYDKILD